LKRCVGKDRSASFSGGVFALGSSGVAEPVSGEQICLDGNTLRGSRIGDRTVHLLSAYAAQARWVLAQQAVGEKTNEITAIPDLLSMLDITGALISIDAMGCQKTIAKTIIDAKADYLLALKDNHKGLCEDVSLWLDTETASGRLPIHETVDKGHGRLEIRRCCLSAQIDWLEQKPEWKGLAAVGRVESTRIIGDKTSVETRYYLCSFTGLERFAQSVRQHWSIRKSAALGAGCAVWRRRQSGQERSFAGTPGFTPANGLESVEQQRTEPRQPAPAKTSGLFE
ncbi:MAG: ISAs1 family transposase, partial [Methylococcaceae bacterium]